VFQAVGFDLGETLIEYEGVALDWQGEYPRALAAVASSWGDSLAPAQIEAGMAVLRRYNTRLAPRRHEVDCALLFAELLVALDVRTQDVSALLDPAIDAFFSVFQRRARPYLDAASSLATLASADVPVGVLTDVPYAMPRRLVVADLSAAGLVELEPLLLTSVEVGRRKPDPAGFVALAECIGCSPAAMLFVGNEEKDILGAKAAGMTAALVWRSEAPIPAWGQDLSVTELEQLPPTVVGR